MELEELLALLPDNTTGAIDAVDLRTIVTELYADPIAPVGIMSLSVGQNMDIVTDGAYDEEHPFLRVRNTGTVQSDSTSITTGGTAIPVTFYTFRYGTVVTVMSRVDLPSGLPDAEINAFYESLKSPGWPLGKPAHPVNVAMPVFCQSGTSWANAGWAEMVSTENGFEVNVLATIAANDGATRLYVHFTFDTADPWPADYPDDGSGKHIVIPAPPVPKSIAFTVNYQTAPATAAINVGDEVMFKATSSGFTPSSDKLTLETRDHPTAGPWTDQDTLFPIGGNAYQLVATLYYQLGQDYDQTWDYRVKGVPAEGDPVYSPIFTIEGM